MAYRCTVARLPAGWIARHDSPEVGSLEVRGLTREEAIEKIRGEIRYRLELCPCTGETYQHIDVQVVDSK